MSNTERKGKMERQKVEVTSARLGSRRVLLSFLLFTLSFFLLGCRQDMQDQPRYEAYEPSRFFADGQASRQLVEGTVPRGYLREDTYFYTGKMPGGEGQQAGSAPGSAGGQQRVDAAIQPAEGTALTQSGGMQGAGGDVNRRGNVAGGLPGADQSRDAGRDVFPFPVTEEVVARGRDRYNVFCSMCHGLTGEGDGLVVRRGFRRPPAFYEDRLQEGQNSASHFFDVITNGWGAMPSYDYMIPAEDRWKIIAYIRALQLSRRLNVNELPPDARSKVATPPTGGSTQHGAGQTPSGQGGEQH